MARNRAFSAAKRQGCCVLQPSPGGRWHLSGENGTKKCYDPYIDGQWFECIADTYAQVHGRSEKEWNLILDEWREHQRQHAQKRVTLNGPLLAQFLQQGRTGRNVLTSA